MWNQLSKFTEQIGAVTQELGNVTQDLLKQTTTAPFEDTNEQSPSATKQQASSELDSFHVDFKDAKNTVTTLSQQLNAERLQVSISAIAVRARLSQRQPLFRVCSRSELCLCDERSLMSPNNNRQSTIDKMCFTQQRGTHACCLSF
jgi:hypothetical protein